MTTLSRNEETGKAALVQGKPFDFAVSDGKTVHVHAWLPERPARALLLVSHGMAEYAGRYARLAARLCSSGWAVYAPDHRGHGQSAAAGELGRLGPGVDYRRLVQDLVELGEELRSRNPGLPLALFGHSFGSLLAQAFLIQRADLLSACALQAVPTPLSPALEAGAKLLVRLGLAMKGERAPAELPRKLSFGRYAAAFAPTRTPADWISRDAAEVDAYLADPYGDFTCSYGFYRELEALMHHLYHSSALALAPRDFPLRFAAGEADPVIGSPAALEALADRYRAAGLRLETRFYPGARHDLLAETNREEVETELEAWLEQALGLAAS